MSRVRLESNIPGVTVLFKRAARRGVKASAIVYQSQIRRLLSGSSPSTPGSPPGNMTGRLQGSISIDDSDPDSVRVGTNLPYAQIQEFGGVITGTMTIPLNKEAQLMRARNQSLRALDLSFVKRKGKPPLLVRESSGRTDFLFVIKNTLTLAARPYMKPALDMAQKSMQRAFVETFRREAKRSLTRGDR